MQSTSTTLDYHNWIMVPYFTWIYSYIYGIVLAEE